MYILTKYLIDEVTPNLVRDPIYGFIEIPKEFIPVIDNNIFQRLRWVSQLPLEQLVYPSAQHSRFEHSLGVMYLAMLTAINLLNDEISRKRIDYAIEEENLLEKSKNNNNFKEKVFVCSAGLIGLLHDVGHAPFSHTLEDATKYTERKISYNHEFIGYKISEYLLRHYYISGNNLDIKTEVSNLVLEVLDKSKKIEDLTPLQKILRTMIDGPLDVDKGDYIIRDSYHCGVRYGYYDLDRLWRNVRISNDYMLGVFHKSAVEAWDLKLARYKMYKNVYKHHVRNITDALLIRVLSDAFDLLDEKKLEIILPIHDNIKKPFDDETILKFSFWNDTLFIKELIELDKEINCGIKTWIKRFMKRDLPKRFCRYSLEEFGNAKLDKEHYIKLKKELKDIDSEILFSIVKNPQPPVFTKDVQNEIKVVKNESEETTLSEYLELIPKIIDVNINDLEKHFENSYEIQIFAYPPKNKNKTLEETIYEKLSFILKDK